MNRVFLFSLIAALALSLDACQKAPTEAERNAEIERQVQQRLATERQADEQQKLAQRQAELDARERTLAEKENRPAATAAPVATAAPPAHPTVDNARETGSYATFYRKLDPYGDWMETNDYGYVFQPQQAAQSRDWRPYTNGHWVYTDAGWTWISEEQFGWATYHYGRWIRLRSVGWVWVPGEQWAPAWVSWRKGSDYVGWAPLPPEAQFDRQIGIRNWADNYYDIGPEQYAFVRANDFGAKVSARVIVPTQQNVTIINQTTNITNITYNNSVIVDRGPSYDDLRMRSSQPIERFRLERTQNTNIDRPVFRGEVVALPTLDFRPADRAARPPRVSRTIAQPVAERGWSGIQNQEAAQTRKKIQSESTPPPNLPPMKFVRPEGQPVIPPRPRGGTNVGTPAPSASPVASAPAAPPAAEPTQPSPTGKVLSPKAADRNRRDKAEAAREEKRKARLEEQARPKTEQDENQNRRQDRQPNETPTETATTTPAPTTAPSATPAPTTAEPSATPAAKTTATATPVEQATRDRGMNQAERRAQRQERMEQHPAEKSAVRDASTGPSEVESKTAAEKRREKKGQRKALRGGGNSQSAPTPAVSASPTANQP